MNDSTYVALLVQVAVVGSVSDSVIDALDNRTLDNRTVMETSVRAIIGSGKGAVDDAINLPLSFHIEGRLNDEQA